MDSLDLYNDSAAIILQLIMGFILEFYVSQVFLALQMTKIGRNNARWTVDAIGHYCEDGHEIDQVAHPFRFKFCSSTILARVLNFIVSVGKYHKSLIGELSNALAMMHEILGSPETLFDNIAILEREYRESVDIRKEFVRT